MRRRKQSQTNVAAAEHAEFEAPGPEPIQSDAVFRRLLDAAPEALLVIDEYERLMYVNTRAEALFGYPRVKLLGRSVRVLVPGGLLGTDSPSHNLLKPPVPGAEPSVILDLIALHATGSELTVQVGMSLVPTDIGHFMLAEIRDATSREQQEGEVRLLQEVSLAVGSAEDLTGALNTILVKLCRFAHWRMGEAWLPDARETYLECRHAWSSPDSNLDEFIEAGKALILRPGEGLAGRAWASRAPVWVRDVRAETELARLSLAIAADLRTAVAVPVLGGRQVVAVLIFFREEERAEDERFIRIISIVAAQLGSLIIRKRVEEELRLSEARYRRIVDTAYEGIAIIDMQGRLSYANCRLAEMLGFGLEEIVGRSAVNLVFVDDRSRAQRLLRLRRKRPPEQLEFRLCRKDGTALWAIVAVSAIWDEDGDFAGILSMVTEINQRKMMEVALRDSERLFRSVLDTLPVGVWIADRDGRIISANPAAHRIWGGARYTNPEDFGKYKAWWFDKRQRVTQRDWALMRAVTRGETSLNEVIEIEAFDGTRKVICNSAMPLRDAKGEITGAIVVNEDISERKKLEVERVKALERERRIANELQECFRPSDPPHLPGYVLGHAYRAALEEAQLGGDFYDIFPLGKDHYGIVMGDVCGKGLDAAVQTVTSKYFLRGYAAEYGDPAQVVRLLNEALSQEETKSHLLTLFYGVLEVPTGKLRYVSGGHEPPLVLPPGSEIPLELESTGPLLGAFPGLQFEEKLIQLEPGTSLLLYTDGVTDARYERQFLQTQGLADLLVREGASLRGQELVDRLLQKVEAFARGYLRDDVALLLIQRLEIREASSGEDPPVVASTVSVNQDFL